MHSVLRKEWRRAVSESGGGWAASLPPCDECGWRGPDEDAREAERHIFTWEGGTDSELLPRDEHGEVKEYCGTCGRKLVWFPSFEDGSGHCYYFMVPRR